MVQLCIKSFAFWLAGLLLFQASGSLIADWIHKSIHQTHMRYTLRKPSESPEQIAMTLAQYESSGYHPNEITHHGKLYDVASVDLRNDSAFLNVYHDPHEENIVKKIVAFITGTPDSDHQVPVPIHPSLSLKYILPEQSLPVIRPDIGNISFAAPTYCTSVQASDIPLPPPKTC